MKINWGSGIAIFYSLFVIVMILMVVKSTQNKVHMVQDNYYDKDLNYEEFRLKRENGAVFKDSIRIDYQSKDNSVLIQFSETLAEAKGKILLFRPSNQFMDKQIELKLNDEASMRIPLEENTLRGKWKVQIDWNLDEKGFYNEEIIVI